MTRKARQEEQTGSKLSGGVVVGDVVIVKLDTIRPNKWNPNRMTPREHQALGHGLKTKGWLKSQALTVWGKDDRGKRRDVIIDGEQRWTVAREHGFEEGPVVFLDGLTEKQARELTIELDSKRGSFDQSALADVLKSLEIENLDLASLNLGIEQDSIRRLLASTSGTFLNDLIGNGGGSSGDNVAPEGYVLTFAFARREDKDAVVEVLSKLSKPTRSAALLHLCEQAGIR